MNRYERNEQLRQEAWLKEHPGQKLPEPPIDPGNNPKFELPPIPAPIKKAVKKAPTKKVFKKAVKKAAKKAKK